MLIIRAGLHVPLKTAAWQFGMINPKPGQPQGDCPYICNAMTHTPFVGADHCVRPITRPAPHHAQLINGAMTIRYPGNDSALPLRTAGMGPGAPGCPPEPCDTITSPEILDPTPMDATMCLGHPW